MYQEGTRVSMDAYYNNNGGGAATSVSSRAASNVFTPQDSQAVQAQYTQPMMASYPQMYSQNMSRQQQRSSSITSLRRPTSEAFQDGFAGGSAASANGSFQHSQQQSLSQHSMVPSPHAAAELINQYSVNGLSPTSEDFVHEILAMNTLAMQRSKAGGLDEAVKMLQEAYMKLSTGNEATCLNSEPQLLDQLKATTLNNMGVTECHRGAPRQALSHFEGARQLEEAWNMASPSVALNSCAAYNALNMYDKATAAALETIDMLRSLEVQRKRERRQIKREQQAVREGMGLTDGGATAGSSSGGTYNNGALTATGNNSTSIMAMKTPQQLQREAAAEADALAAASQPYIADSDNRALWGAAWHNLAIAQINTARSAARVSGGGNRKMDLSECTNALVIFQNAMQATQQLLGMNHPMTKEIIETYRTVRRTLRDGGAFKQHRTRLTVPLPPVDPREQEEEELAVTAVAGRTRHGTLEKLKKDLTITFRGEVTGGAKLVERIDAAPFPGATEEAYQRKMKDAEDDGDGNSDGSRRTDSKKKKNKYNAHALRSMALSETLMRAAEVYGNPHPLLYSMPDGYDGYAEDGQSFAATFDNNGRRAGAGGGQRKRSPKDSQKQQQQPRDGFANTTGTSGRFNLTYGDAGGGKPHQPQRQQQLQPQKQSPPQRQQQPQRQLQPQPQPQRQQQRPWQSSQPHASSKQQGLPAIKSQSQKSRVSNATTGDSDNTKPSRYTSNFSKTSPARSTHSNSSGRGNAMPATETQYEQSKLLLLAQPPSIAQMNTTYYPVELVDTNVSTSSQRPSTASASSPVKKEQSAATAAAKKAGFTDAGENVGVQTDRNQRDVDTQHEDSKDAQEGTVKGSPAGTPQPKELFNAMWVAADDHYLRHGNRALGRPGYYVSTIMRVEEERGTAQPDTHTSLMMYTSDEEDSSSDDSSASLLAHTQAASTRKP